MTITPMCEVRWDERDRPELRGDCRVLLRVPEDKVADLVAVLLLNHVAWFEVTRESAIETASELAAQPAPDAQGQRS
jgi:hypothetical protein